MAGREGTHDPFLGFRFRIELESQEVGGFSEVTGLQVEIETFDYREGGVNDYLHRLAGPARYPANLLLRRGLIDQELLWEWTQEIVQGRIRRQNGSIILLDSSGTDRWRWNFRHGYPIRWNGPELRAGAAEVALETLELAHRGLTTQRT